MCVQWAGAVGGRRQACGRASRSPLHRAALLTPPSTPPRPPAYYAQSDERERVDLLATKLKQMAAHCETHERNNAMLRQMCSNRDRQVELGKLQIGQLSKILAANSQG